MQHMAAPDSPIQAVVLCLILMTFSTVSVEHDVASLGRTGSRQVDLQTGAGN